MRKRRPSGSCYVVSPVRLKPGETHLKDQDPPSLPHQHRTMHRSPSLQPLNPLHQIFLSLSRQRHWVPASVFHSTWSCLSKLKIDPTPVNHLQDSREACAVLTSVIKPGHPTAAEDSFVPSDGNVEVGDGELEVMDAHDLGPVAFHPREWNSLLR